jgi:TolB-like protein
MIYRFDEIVLDSSAFRLTRQGEDISVEPQVFDLLVYLIENAGRAVTRDEIFETIWNGRAVSDSALSSRIKAARKAIGDDGSRQAKIRTLHRRGFIFVAQVTHEVLIPAEVRTTGDAGKDDLPLSDMIAHNETLTSRIMGRPAVAVLSFVNYDGGLDSDYLSAGVTDEIIAALASWRSFPVIARTTTFRYRNTEKTARQIGAEIGAKYLVTGTIGRSAGRIRVTATLTECASEQEIWSSRFNRDAEDLFAVEEEVATEIVAAITDQINAVELGRIHLKPAGDLNAWELAIRANWLVHQPNQQMLEEAERLACRAAELDPGWSFPHGLIAFARFQKAMHRWSDTDPNTAFSETHEAAREAIQVDATSWLGHALCGIGELWNHHNHEKALAHLHHALHLNPSACWSYHFGGCITGFSGDLEAARKLQPRAFSVDPVYPYTGVLRADLALWSMLSGHLDEAKDHIDRSMDWDPGYGRGLHRALAIRGMRGEIDSAGELRRQIEQTAKHALDPVYIRESYPFRLDEHRDRFFDGLRKAGLNI